VAASFGEIKKLAMTLFEQLVKKAKNCSTGDNARAPKFLKNVPLQGYLFHNASKG